MKKVRVGLAGLGNVGRGVYEILQKDAKLLSSRSGVEFEVTAVSARGKKDFVAPKIKFYDNSIDLASNAEVDVVIEVMGSFVAAKNLIEASLKNGKKVVTANKALLAEHGFELAKLAEQTGGFLGFEAAVAGAIPIIKIFKEGLVANSINEFYAILNGTSNFILTKMKSENLDFSVVLKQAQELGYAEADPAFDINGTDTAHKLILLTAIASSTKPALKQISIEGIENIAISDIKLAEALGYKIKLLAIYKNLGKSLQVAVYPALISAAEKISQIDDSFNAILTDGSNAGWSMIVGRGAGTLPTASAIVADLVDSTKNFTSPVFGVTTDKLAEPVIESITNRVGRYFVSAKIDRNSISLPDVFDGKLHIEQQASIVIKGEIFCGFITAIHKESEVLEALQKADPKLINKIKFLRVEACQAI